MGNGEWRRDRKCPSLNVCTYASVAAVAVVAWGCGVAEKDDDSDD